ncbi:MAG: putative holin-like toxin [Hungatella hathewayi]|nr:putative holin-like toxin [Hungatella hathewayi]
MAFGMFIIALLAFINNNNRE